MIECAEVERKYTMNMDRRLFLKNASAFTATGVLLSACAKVEKRTSTATKGKSLVAVKKDKVLVVYFSRSGNTRHVAETFARACGGARLVELRAAKPYAAEYNACCEEAKPECRAGTLRPIRKIPDLDVAAYDAVLVGTPNWWGTMAPPVRTWVSENAVALKGKTLCLFQTHGGGGMQNCARDFAALLPDANVLPAQAYLGATIKARLGLKSFVTDRFTIEG